MNLKKILSVVLAAMMLLSTVSFTVFADETETKIVDSYVKLTADNADDYSNKTITIADGTNLGMIFEVNGDVTIENATIEGNNIACGNGLFYIDNGSTLTLKNCEVNITKSEELNSVFQNDTGKTASLVLDNTIIKVSNICRIILKVGLNAVDSTIEAENLSEHAFRSVYGSIVDTTIKVDGAETLIKNTTDASFAVVGESTIIANNITPKRDTDTAITNTTVVATSEAKIEGDSIESDDYKVVEAFAAKVTSMNVDTYYDAETFDLKEILGSVSGGDVVIELFTDTELSYNAREAYGNEDTTSITIKGNDNTLSLNQTNSDWSSIGMANSEGVFGLEDINVIKTGKYADGGAWNHHAIQFNVNVNFNKVTFDTSVKLGGANSVLNDVDITEDEGFYGLWIEADGQNVEITGGSITATNGGRGIKIGDEYVEKNVAQVSLSVADMVFETAKKAAIMVTSDAGAEIAVENINIEKVAADSTNAVWVDESRANAQENVTVSGASKYVENAVATVGDKLYPSVQAAIDAAQDGDTVYLIDDATISNTIKFDKNITIEGNDHTITVDASKFPKEGTMFSATYPTVPTFNNIVFDGNGVYRPKAIARSANVEGCTFKNLFYGCWLGDGSTVNNCEFINTFYSVASDASVIDDLTYTITNNTFYTGTTYGINLGSAAHAVIEGNTFYGCWNSGNMANTISYSNNTFVAVEGDYNWFRINSTGEKTLKMQNTFTAEEGCTESYTVNLGGNGYTVPLNVDISGSVVLTDGFDVCVEPSVKTDDYDVTVFPVYVDEAKTVESNIIVNTISSVGSSKVEIPNLDTIVDTSSLRDNATYAVVAAAVIPATPVELKDGETVEYIDISVQKNGVEISPAMSNDKGQTVYVTLGGVISGNITVMHWNGEAWEPVEAVTEGNTVKFEATKMSPFAFIYSEGTVETTDIAEKIDVTLKKITDTKYDIVLKGADEKVINRFTSGEFTFKLDTEDALAYQIVKNGYVNVIYPDDNSGKYEFNLNGVDKADITGAEITVASVEFSGYGKGTFSIVGENNVVHTTECVDNIVDTFVTTNDTLAVLDAKVDIEIAVPTQALTVSVDFPNAVEDNAIAYQDMKVVVSGGDLDAEIVYDLGTGENAMTDDGKYAVTATLTKDVAYTVTVSGAGYRTARCTVTMSEDKNVSFWNNVKDTAVAVVEGKTPVTKNFLAGDIVGDNNINIYDLSAVVSYFGTENNVEEYSDYAKYDLNRDGVIDSKDVAYVLVSWGE